MDFAAVLTEHFVVVVVMACLCFGYVIKRWVKDVENKYIPTILAVLGAVLNVIESGMSLESIVYGAFMGLTATGLHQAFTRFIEKSDK